DNVWIALDHVAVDRPHLRAKACGDVTRVDGSANQDAGRSERGRRVRNENLRRDGLFQSAISNIPHDARNLERRGGAAARTARQTLQNELPSKRIFVAEIAFAQRVVDDSHLAAGCDVARREYGARKQSVADRLEIRLVAGFENAVPYIGVRLARDIETG